MGSFDLLPARTDAFAIDFNGRAWARAGIPLLEL